MCPWRTHREQEREPAMVIWIHTDQETEKNLHSGTWVLRLNSDRSNQAPKNKAQKYECMYTHNCMKPHLKYNFDSRYYWT